MSDDEWTDEDAAAVYAEGLPSTHPLRAVRAFVSALQSSDPQARWVLESLTTPESRAAWGDFAEVRAFAMEDYRISTTAHYERGAPDVAYVKFAPDEGAWVRGTVADNAMTWATLVWRPELSEWGPFACWRVHKIGAQVPAADLPRSAPGFDPKSL